MCYFSAEGHSRNSREDEVLVVKRQPHGRLLEAGDGSGVVVYSGGNPPKVRRAPGGKGNLQDEGLVEARSVCAEERTESAA